MKQNATISLLVGICISAAALFLAFRNVPFGELVDYLKAIDCFWAFWAVVLVPVSFAVRAYRWQIILGPASAVGFWQAYHPLMIGFMLNCILPGRIGEIARPFILKKKEGVAFTTGLATVAAERVFDVLMLIALFAVVMTFVEIDPDLELAFGDLRLNRETLMAVSTGMVRLCGVLIAGIGLVSVKKTRDLMVRLVLACPDLFFFVKPPGREKIRQRLCLPLVGMLENIASGFEMVKQPRQLVVCLALSALVWGLGTLSYYLTALAAPELGRSYGEISAVMVIICFFIALPSVPGFWGIWEAGGVFALALFGVPAKEAAGFALASHVIQMFPVIFAGLASAVITGVSLRQVTAGIREK
jgi:glycosyltransferase 2 family protein